MMGLKIGFHTETVEEKKTEPGFTCYGRHIAPVKSVVRVAFAGHGTPLTYYNDRFDLRRGDLVYVDGKQEGLRGRVVDVSYSFKIKVSDYQHVIALADTDVHGTFQMAGSHLVTFDSSALPFEKVLTWFLPPAEEDEEYASGSDGTTFQLDDLGSMNVSARIGERGHVYYTENKVVYLCIDCACGHAIVEGTQPYELEFTYKNGEISNLVCSCYCTYPCKHEVAAMLQLRETLELIEKHYPGSFLPGGSFAAISKTAFFSLVLDGKDIGSFTL